MNTSSRTPLLQLDTSNINVDDSVFTSISVDLASPYPAREDSQTTSPFTVARSFQPDKSHASSEKPNNRALNESRKLLAHLLEQLEERKMPPSVFENFRTISDSFGDKSFGAIVETVRGAVRFKAALMHAHEARTHSVAGEDEEEDEDTERGFSTNDTFELLLRLRDLLVVSMDQGWQIFHDK
jgi:hypothetical protein